MAAVANSPAFAKKVGVPRSVGQDFIEADKGRKFLKGGDTMATKKPFPFAFGGKETKKEEKTEKKMSKSAYAKGERKEAKKGKC